MNTLRLKAAREPANLFTHSNHNTDNQGYFYLQMCLHEHLLILYLFESQPVKQKQS